MIALNVATFFNGQLVAKTDRVEQKTEKAVPSIGIVAGLNDKCDWCGGSLEGCPPGGWEIDDSVVCKQCCVRDTKQRLGVQK